MLVDYSHFLLLFYFLDVNECDNNKPLHDCGQLCVNKVPGFVNPGPRFLCDCEKGYRLNADGKNCAGKAKLSVSRHCVENCTGKTDLTVSRHHTESCTNKTDLTLSRYHTESCTNKTDLTLSRHNTESCTNINYVLFL